MSTGVRPVAEWPRLLAGPMVRRVTASRAHVFVATSVHAEVEVELYAGRRRHDAAGSAVSTSGKTALRRIGKRLWVGVVGVDVPASVGPGAVVGYDVLLHDDGTVSGLHDLGLLGGSSADDPRRGEVPLGYEDGFLPSFVTPVADVADLRLVHGSCRKPHGGGDMEADALQLLDAELGRLLTDATADAGERPQQLILTGDQIYADDVAPALLAACTEAGEQLLGWDEPLPLPAGQDEDLLQPGWRTRYLSLPEIKEIPPDGATDYSANHLLRFGEWCAMYLFAWSDALWAIEDEDEVDDAPGVHPGYTLPDKPVVGAAPAWDETRAAALAYAASVCGARRVLANVATYMMFDDHEVTDDWYLNQRVHDRLKGVGQTGALAEIGPRLLRNGLSAYTIFQHWGNVPDDFASGATGDQLLDLWAWTDTNQPSTLERSPRDADELLDLALDASGEPQDPTIPASGDRGDFDRIRWDYAIGFPAHRLISLDTRTWRHFPAAEPLTWASLATAEAPVHATSASGGDELRQVAAAWAQAGTDLGDQALTAYAELLDAVVDAVDNLTDDAATLRPRIARIVTALADLLGRLPGRAAIPVAERLDPIHTTTYDLVSALSTAAAVLSGRTLQELHDLLIQILHHAATFDFGAGGRQLTDTLIDLAAFTEAAVARAEAAMAHAAARTTAASGDDLWDALTTNDDATARAQLASAVQSQLQALDSLVANAPVAELSQRLFRDGDSRLGAGLIRSEALPWMVTRPIADTTPTGGLTLLLSPPPIFGNRLVEAIQRASVAKALLQGEAAEEEFDYEAWSLNQAAMADLFEAAGALDAAVVLSGDVHYAGSLVADLRLRVPSTGGSTPTTVTTRYVQLTSSATRNADMKTRALATADDLLWDEDGELALFQSDWMSLLEGGSPAADHLQKLARVELGQELDELGADLDPDRLVRQFKRWWNSEIDWQGVLEMVGALITQTPQEWARKLSWELTTAVASLRDLLEDPLGSIFGDYLTAGELARQVFRDLYRDLGLDASVGLTPRETVLTDRRALRLAAYPVADRYAGDSMAAEVRERQERRTVGHANLGLVSVGTRAGEITEIAHELRWYIEEWPIRDETDVTDPDAERRTREAAPRPDWYGTLHRAGWRGVPADIAKIG